MIWVGLTGGIASGKSTVSSILKKLGYVVVDADSIVHQLLQAGKPAFSLVVNHFGSEILSADGGIDRKKLGAIVFSYPVQLVALENILHPLVKIEVEKQRKQTKDQGVKVAFYDVPLLFEKKLQSDFDYTVVVSCSEQQQLQRMTDHRGLTTNEAQARLNQQLPLPSKEKLASFVIQNQSDIAALDPQVKNILQKIIP